MSIGEDDTSQILHNLMEYNSSEWQPVSLTFVEYPRGDIIGKFLAMISLAPLGIGSGFVALILFRRDLHTITFFLGTLFNEIVNMILKYWIKQPRPVFRTEIYSEYGMPSSHSQFMCFFASYVLLFVLIRLHSMNNNNASLERAARLLVISGCWTTSALVCFGRIYLQYHSWSQVIVGAIVGSLFGFLWFFFTHFILAPKFPYVVSWKISEFFLLRDTTLIPNIVWFEYTVTRKETRARQRKLISMKSQ